ncbi:HTH-type transcriptional regulator MalT [Celerinatantimonas sp. YJH-8]|uniref:HTH-type transcriptional regulator MalT n=1 Tax=Celerinatantimonas sp. YJH-8 TaxID=3228714 RepID=UPI0038C48BCB
MLLPAKLSRPRQLKNVVIRQRLLDKLGDAKNYHLVLLTSPAGYGKTTMVTQWAEQLPHVGWLSLDEQDNFSERFAAYLVESVQQATDQFCQRSSVMANKRQYANLTALVSQLLVELSQWPEHLYLVLDDYHQITSNEIHDAMRFFIRNQPDNVTLVILSRMIPTLGIARLRIRERLLEIDSQQLAFTHDEAQQFFECRLPTPVAKEQSDKLCDEVAGWVTAFQLLVISSGIDAHPPLSGQGLAGISASHLNEYLVEEVINRTQPQTREFLLRCGLLRSMCHQLIEAVTGYPNSQQWLEEIERQGLFVQRLDDAGQWFCFHPLFASFLRQRCALEMAEQLPAIHQAAAQGWLDLGYPNEAIQHALSSDNSDLLITILSDYGWTLFNHSELALLNKCLASFSSEQLVAYPKLLLLRAWLAQSQHRISEAELLLVDAETLLQEHHIEINRELNAEFQALRAQVAINNGQLEAAESYARHSLDELPAHNFYARIVATSVIGEVLHCRAQLEQGLKVMQQCELMAIEHGVFHYALWSLLQQSEILIAQGLLQAAYEVQVRAFQLVETEHLQQLPMHEFLLRLRSQLLWSWGRLDESEQAARKGLDVIAHYPARQQLQCLAMLAKCDLVRGNLDNARVHLSRCENLLSGGYNHIDWIINVDKPRVIYWQMTGDRNAALQWLATTMQPDGAENHFLQGQWRNIARAQIIVGQYQEAEKTLTMLNKNAEQLGLVSDLNRNYLILNSLYWHSDQPVLAQKALIEALRLASRTGFISHFVIEGEILAQQLRQLLQLDVLGELETQRAHSVLRQIDQHDKHKVAHFDEQFVEQLLQRPDVPELVRVSPLTTREWQVLGLIYSGFSNEQIATELDVAATTIKTHIRNLYQKLGISHRREAIAQAQQFLQMMGYASESE